MSIHPGGTFILDGIFILKSRVEWFIFHFTKILYIQVAKMKISNFWVFVRNDRFNFQIHENCHWYIQFLAIPPKPFGKQKHTIPYFNLCNKFFDHLSCNFRSIGFSSVQKNVSPIFNCPYFIYHFNKNSYRIQYVATKSPFAFLWNKVGVLLGKTNSKSTLNFLPCPQLLGH